MNSKQRQWMATDDDMDSEQTRQGRGTRQGIWDMSNFRMQLAKVSLAVGLGVMSLFGGQIARADGPSLEPAQPAIVVAGAAQTDEVISPNSFAFPMVYVSSPETGNVQGTGYADEDIMRYNSGNNTWSKAFDGTNAGLADAADIDALTVIVNSGYLSFLMSFDNPTAVPGLGTVDDSDVARYDTWNGQWSLYLDGSVHGLTTAAEDIDALTFTPGGFLAVSTTGNFAVKALGGGTLKGADEDLFSLINAGTHEWTLWLDGAAVGLQGANDLTAVSFMPVNDTLVDDARYIVAQKNFTLPNGVAIDANDVAEQVWYQNGSTEFYKQYDNTTIGFAKIDALEVVK